MTLTAGRRSLVAVAALALCLVHGTAQADTKLRVGKAQPNQFAFVPADIGVETGIFKKHGLDVETSAFGGDAKMMQALTADGIDIALGGGPAFATIVKGAPMMAIAPLSGQPSEMVVAVKAGGPVKSVADLKGRTVRVHPATLGDSSRAQAAWR